MIRAVVRNFGAAAEVVGTERYAPDRIGPGRLRIRMRASAVNPSDIVTISGAYASRTPLPFVPGFEGMGVVEETAGDAHGLAVGDRVLPIGSAGAWQEVKVTEARWCFPVPADLADEEAATSYINPLTAWIMLHERAAPSGRTRLAVNAANSAIGRIIIRMANTLGLEPVALVRSDRAAAGLAGLGTAAVIDATRPDAMARLREATGGRGPDVALDAVGGKAGGDLAAALAPGGHLIHYGLLSGEPLPQDLRLRRPDIRLELFWLRNWIHAASREAIEQALGRMALLVRDGTAATHVEARYPLSSIREALRHNVRPGRTGKILVIP
jgi:NADPH:quinone reductase-like Zn-dependent oxidoreductase